MTEYLLAISIGPVQEFIAAARKTRDLWFGSAMLSAGACSAAQALQKRGAQLIFPSPHGLESGAAVANKLLATTTDDPSSLVEAARAAAGGYLEQGAAAALQHKGNLRVDEALLRAQLGEFLEFYAAWVPCTADSYREDRARLERLLAGRKALRDFQPAAGRDGVFKSSLDPSRESVIDWRGWRPGDRPPAGTREREQLDGISLIKRLAEPERFVSVSRVAIDPLIRRLKAAEPAALGQLRKLASELGDTGAVEGFRGFPQFGDFPFDTELFYGEDDRVPPDRAGTMKEFRRVLHSALERLEIGEPPAYYAVLAADGDRMGELIGQANSVAEHQQLSDRLVTFASESTIIVKRHQGVLVYSGGDDVLAFVPLDTAVSCADNLRRAFAQCVSGPDGRRATPDRRPRIRPLPGATE